MSRLKQLRLTREWEAIERLATSPLLDFTTEETPPRVYHFTLYTKGLYWDEGRQEPVCCEHHQFTIRLGAGYPMETPDVTWKTPIFHPNIRREAVCHSNQWAPSWTLADFVVELHDMVRLKKFNVNSPLDSKAAAWVRQHLQQLPLDPRGLREISPTITIRPRSLT